MSSTAPAAEPLARLDLQPSGSVAKASTAPSPRPHVPWTQLTGAARISRHPEAIGFGNLKRLATLICGAGCLGVVSAYVVSG